MSIEIEDVLPWLIGAIGILLYYAIGSVTASLLGIESGFAWFAVAFAWPLVVGFLVMLFAVVIRLIGSAFK